jgi:hypothetical protein
MATTHDTPRVACKLPDVATEIDKRGHDSAKLEDRIKREASRRIESKQLSHQDQMSR